MLKYLEVFKKFFPIAPVLIFSFWPWKIFSDNILLGLIVLASSLCLWFLIKSKSKYFSLLFIFLFLILLFFQWQTTQKFSLTSLDNDEQHIQQMRVNEYPPIHIKIGTKIMWIPLANLFELRKESIVFSRVEKNFYEVIDPNLYFFANHPRERVGIKEFEKFPYIFIPFFLAGVFLLIKNRSSMLSKIGESALVLSLALPIILTSLIGHKNPLGPFAIFPFFAVVIGSSFENTYQEISKLPKAPKSLILIFGLVLFILVFLQILSYAKY